MHGTRERLTSLSHLSHFFFSSRRRHTRFDCDWSSDVCSSDLAPRRTPHFHINLLPEARNVPTTRAIMDAYLKYLHELGEKKVYGQMVTFRNRRGEIGRASCRERV